MVEVIILALVTLFVFVKLFSILGDTQYDRELSDEEKNKFEEFRKSVAEIIETREAHSRQIEIASALEASLAPEDREVLDVVRKHDAGFNSEKFLKGCRSAYEMIISAFADEDKDTLKQLLDEELYKSFTAEIDKNKANNQILDITLIGITKCSIVSTSLENRNSVAIIDVRFTSDQIKVVKDKVSDSIIGGSTGTIQKLDEIWSFKRNLLAQNNIWKLVSVSSYDEE